MDKILVFVFGLGPEICGENTSTFATTLSFYIVSSESLLQNAAPSSLHSTALISSPNKPQTKSDRVTGIISFNMGGKYCAVL
jgi:hypothetical protein